MVRAVGLAIVLSLSGAPAVGVVCGFLCSQNASSTADHSGCRDDQSGSPGARIARVHDCDHLTPVNPFLLRASQSAPTLQVTTADVSGVLRASSEHSFALSGDWLPPLSGEEVVLHSRSPILRI